MEIEPVKNMYKGGFFKNRNRLAWRAPIVAEALINTFALESTNHSVIDVGCAIGEYVAEFQKLGFSASGIEGSEAAREFFVTDVDMYVLDLREAIEFYEDDLKKKRFDLAYSLEVAEHIEPFYADMYIDNLCALSDTILISAATPGQKGHGHVNCAPKAFWITQFAKRGYIHMRGIENTWKSELSMYRTKKELSSYIKNVIVFRRQNAR